MNKETIEALIISDIDEGELIQLLPQYTFRQYDTYIFYRAYDFELPKIRAFLDFFNQ